VKSGIYTHTTLAQVSFGMPLAESLPATLAQLERSGQSANRVMALVSATLQRKLNLEQQLSDIIGDRLVACHDGIPAHSPRPAVWEAMQIARQRDADVLLSIGGGSIMDACKLIQLCLNADIQDENELLRYARRGDGSTGDRYGASADKSTRNAVFQIAVPSTLSGAEFSENAGILNPATASKEGYRGAGLSPRAIIYDPLLVQHTPMWLWLSTAVRSLDHAVEGYCSADAYPYLQGQYLSAMRLLSKVLPDVLKAPQDGDLRTVLQQAVWLAGAALGKVRHGASHGIGYILGAQCGVPHGYTSCVMLPAVLKWNAQETVIQQREMAEAMGAGENPLGDWLQGWVRDMDLPASLQELGISRERLARIAESAARHPVVRNNPRSIRSSDDVMQILELAW